MQKILDLASQRSMVGLLEQMVVLSAHAQDVFRGVMEEATRTFERIAVMSERVQKLADGIPQVEEYFKTTPAQQLFETGRSFWHAKQVEDAQVFRAETKPECIDAPYKEAVEPPNLAVMDPFMDNGESALKRYTNPEFFLLEWIQAMEKQREEAKKARKEKKKTRQTRP
jgi:hypothetical protein